MLGSFARASLISIWDNPARARSASAIARSLNGGNGLMYKTIITVAAVLFTGAGVCLAQPPGITREMIERALPVEGAPLAEPGPYKVTSEGAFGSPSHIVFRPTTLDSFPKKDTMPVMVWGNGGCAIDS